MVWFRKNERWMNDLTEKWKTIVFINERSYWKKQFYWTIQRETNYTDGKWTIIFFERLKKNGHNGSFTIDGRTKWKKPNTFIFTWDSFSKLLISLYFTKQKKLRILLKRGIHIITHFFLHADCFYFRTSTSTLHIYLGINCQD